MLLISIFVLFALPGKVCVAQCNGQLYANCTACSEQSERLGLDGCQWCSVDGRCYSLSDILVSSYNCSGGQWLEDENCPSRLLPIATTTKTSSTTSPTTTAATTTTTTSSTATTPAKLLTTTATTIPKTAATSSTTSFDRCSLIYTCAECQANKNCSYCAGGSCRSTCSDVSPAWTATCTSCDNIGRCTDGYCTGPDQCQCGKGLEITEYKNKTYCLPNRVLGDEPPVLPSPGCVDKREGNRCTPEANDVARYNKTSTFYDRLITIEDDKSSISFKRPNTVFPTLFCDTKKMTCQCVYDGFFDDDVKSCTGGVDVKAARRVLGATILYSTTPNDETAAACATVVAYERCALKSTFGCFRSSYNCSDSIQREVLQRINCGELCDVASVLSSTSIASLTKELLFIIVMFVLFN